MARSTLLAALAVLGCVAHPLRGGADVSGVAPTIDSQATSQQSTQQSSQQSTQNSQAQTATSSQQSSQQTTQQSSQQTTQNTQAGSANSSQATTQVNSAASTQATGDASAGSTQTTAQNSSVAVLSTVGIGTTAVGIGLLIWALQPAAAAAPAAAHAYLRANARQLREDLAVGAGPVIEDLAHAARIRPENLDRFGTLLRMHRAELLALADPARHDDGRAAAALRRIGELARTDEALAADGARMAAEALSAP